nr:ring canal kelch protein-like [Dermacentor andersoni]
MRTRPSRRSTFAAKKADIVVPVEDVQGARLPKKSIMSPPRASRAGAIKPSLSSPKYAKGEAARTVNFPAKPVALVRMKSHSDHFLSALDRPSPRPRIGRPSQQAPNAADDILTDLRGLTNAPDVPRFDPFRPPSKLEGSVGASGIGFTTTAVSPPKRTNQKRLSSFPGMTRYSETTENAPKRLVVYSNREQTLELQKIAAISNDSSNNEEEDEIGSSNELRATQLVQKAGSGPFKPAKPRHVAQSAHGRNGVLLSLGAQLVWQCGYRQHLPVARFAGLPCTKLLCALPEMCTTVEGTAKHMDTGDATGRSADGYVVTVSSEAAQLFHDDGRPREFAPGAVAKAMAGLRDQRKIRQYCDVVFRAADGADIWAHRFVLSAKFSGCYALFTLAKKGMSPDQTQKDVWTPPILVVMEDLDSDMIELLIDFAYHTPLHERIGLHNIGKVLDLAEKLKIFQIRDHCLSTLKKNLDPESCINIYHLASSRGYEHLAGEAFRYLVRNFDEVWKNTTQFHALTPEELRTILEDDHLYAPSEVEDTFGAILKWISANVDERKAYLAKFLPLVRFSRCSVTDFEKVIGNPQVVDDGDSLKVLNVIRQTLNQQSMAVGVVAGVDLSPKLWLTPRVPKDILFLFGGWTVGATNNMLTYNCRAAKWRVMGNQYTSPRAYHGAAVINQCIYFVGGFNGRECYHSVVCFEVPLAKWSARANMAYARCYVSVAVLQASTDKETQSWGNASKATGSAQSSTACYAPGEWGGFVLLVRQLRMARLSAAK